jgi:hypothetical protein
MGITDRQSMPINMPAEIYDVEEAAHPAKVCHIGIMNEKSLEIVAENARLATETEHELTLWQAIKIYRKALAWSVLVSMATVMESYDIQIIGSFYGYRFLLLYGLRQSPLGGWSARDVMKRPRILYHDSPNLKTKTRLVLRGTWP